MSTVLGDIDGDGDLDLIVGNAFRPTRLFLNQSGTFDASPSWESSEESRTQSVVLADLDGDGDLDLFCGNAGQPSAIYRNDHGQLTVEPIWHSVPIANTRSVAIGDIDGDGDLDLVTGNGGQIAMLFLNQNGVVDSTPAWSSASPMYTLSVTLGDLDGDGDLDLVCGNSAESSAAFRNDNGIFTSAPVWKSIPDQTQSVALGDVDEDGDLDLVCGNSGQPTTLYENRGSFFDSDPAWTSGRFDDTRSLVLADLTGDGNLDLFNANYCGLSTIFENAGGRYFEELPFWHDAYSNEVNCLALGDLDGDGDLDLVCGETGSRPNVVYRNDDGVFTLFPVWRSAGGSNTTCIALGDLDQDGDLDLVCGSASSVSAAYRNDDGVLESQPMWQSYSNNTLSVALGDIDADGYLDLVCGTSGSACMYRNTGGNFESYPSWQSSSALYATNIALGDLDGDGDLDLVCAPNSVFLNVNGTFATASYYFPPNYWTTEIALGDIDGDGDLDIVWANQNQPIALYSNLGASFGAASWLSRTSDDTRTLRLEDLDGDGDLDLVCGNYNQPAAVYRNDGGTISDFPVWRFDAAQNMNRLALGDLDGDGDIDLATANATGLFLFKARRSPVFHGDPLHPTHQLPNTPGFLRSVRLQNLGPNSYRVSFNAIDPNADSLQVLARWQPTGKGNSFPITLTGLKEASPEGVPQGFDWNVSSIPADMTEVTLRLSTISQGRIGGLNQYAPTYIFKTGRMDIRGPRIRLGSPTVVFHSVTVGDTSATTLKVLNAGTEPLILESMTFQVNWIWTSATFPMSIPPKTNRSIPLFMSPAGTGYFAAPLEIKTNDPNASSLTVMASLYARSVDFALADFYPNHEIQQGLPLNVYALMGDSVRVDSVNVSYRRSGEAEDLRLRLTRTGPYPREQYTGEIPADSIGVRTFSYGVEVHKNGNVYLSDFRQIQVRVTNLAFPTPQTAGKYRLVSVPLTLEGTIAGSMVDDVGAPNPAAWRLFAYNAADTTYHELLNESNLRWTPGRAYWLITRGSAPLDTGPEEGLSIPAGFFLIELNPGWNLVANPFPFPVEWSSVDAISDLSKIEPPVFWSGSGYAPEPADVLQPFSGYWVANTDSLPVAIYIPDYPFQLAKPSPRLESSPMDWSIHILASSGPSHDDGNVFGQSARSSEGWDSFDRSEPPAPPGHSISLFFPHPDWRPHAGNYTRDIQPRADGHLWEFDVRAQGLDAGNNEAIDLEFQGISDISAQTQILLLDRELGRTIDLREQPVYSFFPVDSQTEARFEVVVGSAEFIHGLPQGTTLPLTNRLLPVRPNPFRSGTVIRYELAQPSPVDLSVYDIQGRLVRILEHMERQPGRYEVSWRGEDDQQLPVPPGVYFLRLTTRLSSQAVKVLRIQ